MIIISLKNIIHSVFLVFILCSLAWVVLNRDVFFKKQINISSIQQVDSIGFENIDQPHTTSHKAVDITPHEISVSPPPKKKYSPKYLVVFLSKGILGAINGNKYEYTYYNINLPKDISKGKSKKGDMLAPIGDYYILQHDLRGNKMYLTINYPNSKDAAKALKAGTISQAEYKAIVDAQKNSALPPFNTPLGGPVVIRGDGVPGKNTAGNIGISPDAMKNIWEFAKKGTPIRILP